VWRSSEKGNSIQLTLIFKVLPFVPKTLATKGLGRKWKFFIKKLPRQEILIISSWLIFYLIIPTKVEKCISNMTSKPCNIFFILSIVILISCFFGGSNSRTPSGRDLWNAPCHIF
jgi:hypothetical protein